MYTAISKIFGHPQYAQFLTFFYLKNTFKKFYKQAEK